LLAAITGVSQQLVSAVIEVGFMPFAMWNGRQFRDGHLIGCCQGYILHDVATWK
jgi:hypothetical protein